MFHRTITRLLVALTLAVTAFAVTASPVLALDARKTAEALAQRAAKAFEGGNMTEAATLYREAYKMDPGESAYLYGAARAAHAGRDLGRAEADYAAFIELQGADPARVQKAKGFLESLRAELSVEKMAEAKKAEAAGDALLATTYYLEAWRMAPDRADPLLKAAILERQLGDKKAAIGHLQRYLQLAPADANGRGTAEMLLKQLGGAAPAAPPPKPAVVETPKPVVQPPTVQPKPVVAPPAQVVTVPPPTDKPTSSRRVIG